MAVKKKYNRNTKTSALGRGLDALISTDNVSTQGSSTINEIPISRVANLTKKHFRSWRTLSHS